MQIGMSEHERYETKIGVSDQISVLTFAGNAYEGHLDQSMVKKNCKV
jgi:hypothetical protein